MIARMSAWPNRYARLLGFNWSFTPVVDINARHLSAAIGTRSFGADVDAVMAASHGRH